MNEYQEGFSYSIRYGDPKAEWVTLVVLGNQDNESAPYIMMAATADHPLQADLSDCQAVRVAVGYETWQPFGQVNSALETVWRVFEAAGWKVVPMIAEHPDAANKIEPLAASNDFRFLGTPVADFPSQPAAAGIYNAARGFSALVEKKGTAPVFTATELDEVIHLVEQVITLIFGKCLPRQKL